MPAGSRDDPWQLTTPPGTSAYFMYRDEVGAADESKPTADGTAEAWGRSPDNPVDGWYGLRKGYRGRFGMYLPPLLEALGLSSGVSVEFDSANRRRWDLSARSCRPLLSTLKHPWSSPRFRLRRPSLRSGDLRCLTCAGFIQC
jgi:hypothetical protein